MFLRRILFRITFYFAVIAGGSLYFQNSCQAGIMIPISRTALSGQFSKNFPQRKHINMYREKVSLEERLLREVGICILCG